MISDDELEREAQDFVKRVRAMYPLSIKKPLTVKYKMEYGQYESLCRCFTYISWFFKTFEQDTFDYHLCLN
jgi:hypothetical protein